MSISYPLTPPSAPTTNKIRLSSVTIIGESRSPYTASSQMYQWPGEYWTLEGSLPPMKRADASVWLAWMRSLRGKSGTFEWIPVDGKTAQGSAGGTPLADSGGLYLVYSVGVASGTLTVTFQSLFSAADIANLPTSVLSFSGLTSATFLNGQQVTVATASNVAGKGTITATVAYSPYTPHTDTGQATGNITQNAAGSTSLGIRGASTSQTGWLKAHDFIQVQASGKPKRLHVALTDVNTDSSGRAVIDIFPRLRESLEDGASIVLSNPKGTFRLATNQIQDDIEWYLTHTTSFTAIEAI